jgi:uncharacterized integral membrane protein
MGCCGRGARGQIIQNFFDSCQEGNRWAVILFLFLAGALIAFFIGIAKILLKI